MDTYIIIIITSIITLILLLISPPEKFYNVNVKWYEKFTWRAWTAISLSIITTLLTVYKQQQDDIEDENKKEQMNRIEKRNESIIRQLEKIGLRFDSNSNKILTKIEQKRDLYSNNTKEINNTNYLMDRPFIDVCIRGIQVKSLNDTTLYFNIPYCAIDQNSVHNLKLQSTIIYKWNNKYYVLANGNEVFPEETSVTDKLGKAIEYKISPTKNVDINQLYIFVKGSYTGVSKQKKYKVQDIFRKSAFEDSWIRLADSEDKNVRDFLKSKKVY